MSDRSIVIAWLALSTGVAVAASGGEWRQPEVADRVVVLESADASAEERTEALEALREAARGRPSEDLTREAILALSKHLRSEEQERPDEALSLMQAAASYYPDDPRSAGALLRLGSAQMESGDRLAAHFTLARLFRRPDAPDDPELLVRASENAASIGEMDAAIAWSHQVEPDAVPAHLQPTFWRVRLVAGEAQGRHDLASDALSRLGELAPEMIRRDADTLQAAARTDAALGRLDSAAARFQAFVNIHPRHAERPAVLLEQGRLLARMQRIAASLRAFDWIVQEYPESGEVDLARLERVGADPELSPLERAAAYSKIAGELRSGVYVSEACGRILETLLAAGEPLEALSTLARMTKQNTLLPPLHARKHLVIGIEPALAMLADRGDDVGTSATAALIEALGIELPRPLVPLVQAARRRLGLPTDEDREIEAALAAARDGRWDDVVRVLGDAPSDATVPPSPAAFTRERLLAEADWRLGATAAAVERLGAALESRPLLHDARPLLVLRADIRFAAGARDTACADYRAAADVAATTWVARQLTGCNLASPSPEEKK